MDTVVVYSWGFSINFVSTFNVEEAVEGGRSIPENDRSTCPAPAD